MATPTSLFTSDRERRLWCWALAVVAAIYSTLGLAGTLAEVLRENNLMRAAFFFLIYNALSERSENGRRCAGAGGARAGRDRAAGLARRGDPGVSAEPGVRQL